MENAYFYAELFEHRRVALTYNWRVYRILNGTSGNEVNTSPVLIRSQEEHFM